MMRKEELIYGKIETKQNLKKLIENECRNNFDGKKYRLTSGNLEDISKLTGCELFFAWFTVNREFIRLDIYPFDNEKSIPDMSKKLIQELKFKPESEV